MVIVSNILEKTESIKERRRGGRQIFPYNPKNFPHHDSKDNRSSYPVKNHQYCGRGKIALPDPTGGGSNYGA